MTDEAILNVVAAGPHVSVQDGGRPGFMRFGVPASGAVDPMSLAIANVALGNDAGAAAIEVSAGGLTLECRAGAVTFAVCGGGFRLVHGSDTGPVWTVRSLRAGERLELRPGFWGSWCYLAVAGRLAAPDWLGSRSTHAPSGLGGGMLRPGDVITVGEARVRDDLEGELSLPVVARPRRDYAVVLGPQERFFPPRALAGLLGETFVLSDAYDRMGVRLRGPDLTPEGALSAPSEAVARGSVQVSGDGVATVLLADHQTTGGYPKIATLVSSELDSFVQLRPRAPVRFHAVTPEAAVDLARRHARVVRGILDAVAARH